MKTYKELTPAQAAALVDSPPPNLQLVFRDDREGTKWSPACLLAVYLDDRESPFVVKFIGAFQKCAQLIETPDVYEPWSLETAPKGVVLLREKPPTSRGDATPPIYMVQEWHRLKIGFGGYLSLCYADVLRHKEHSLDGGKTWSVCGTLKTEGAK